jgi:pimeloyl-ACP methyl ester carboxylesterase
MAQHNARPLSDGSLTYSYDPQIAKIFEYHPTGDVNLWPSWENLRQPLLLIRGAKSVVLTEAIAIRMKEILPHMDYVTFADCGHVPSLMNEEQIKNISAWLASTPTS